MNALQTTRANPTPITIQSLPVLTEEVRRLATSNPLAALQKLRKATKLITQRMAATNHPLTEQEQQTIEVCKMLEEMLWHITRNLEPLFPDAGGLNDWMK